MFGKDKDKKGPDIPPASPGLKTQSEANKVHMSAPPRIATLDGFAPKR